MWGLACCQQSVKVTEKHLQASLVILAIGWKQELPFIDRETRSMLVEPDGQYKLYRMILNPELPGLGTVGFNSSFITTLSADLPPSRSGS
jgi:dimethylaniline monooxygenase (N-oxide forming)